MFLINNSLKSMKNFRRESNIFIVYTLQYNTMKWVNTTEQIFHLPKFLLPHIKVAYSVAEHENKDVSRKQNKMKAPHTI